MEGWERIIVPHGTLVGTVELFEAACYALANVWSVQICVWEIHTRMN